MFRANHNWILLLQIALLVPGRTTAQIVPDRTLPDNSSVQTQGDRTLINDGTEAGNNLFHSFEEFSVPTGTAAWFNNGAQIENIITRVTGENLSNIDGLIGANGSANLFFINPNGIIFGPNAQLAIGGSFVGTTAESLLFEDATFAATPADAPLLTVNVPVGLQMGQGSGIQVQGNGSQGAFAPAPVGLAVAPGETLALVGREIRFDSGVATVPSGRLELAGVAQGDVRFSSAMEGMWEYEGVEQFGDIRLSDRSLLTNPNFSPNPNGGIYLTGANLTLDSSQVGAVTLGTAAGADITLTASESVNLRGADNSVFPYSSVVTNVVNEGASGSSGQIRVTAPNLFLQDGGRIFTLSFGAGAANTVSVEADSVRVNGFTPFVEQSLAEGNDPNSRIASASLSTGAGGDVEITTGQLTLLNGGTIGTETGPLATGKGGNVNINASSISAISNTFRSTIGSNSLGAGDSGSVNISTERLSLQDKTSRLGAAIATIASGTGKSGDVTVTASESVSMRQNSTIGTVALGPHQGGNVRLSTGQLILNEGAGVASFSSSALPLYGLNSLVPGSGAGNAGHVFVDASESVEVAGVSSLYTISALGSYAFSAGDAGDVIVSTPQLYLKEGGSILSAAAPGVSALGEPFPGAGTGSGGDVTVNAEIIEVSGSAPLIATPSLLGASSFGVGSVGNTLVNASQLFVRDGGQISSSTSSAGDAGSLTINASDILVSGTDTTGSPAAISATALVLSDIVRETLSLPPLPTGDTGKLSITTNTLTVTDGGSITVQHPGAGDAGNLTVNAESVLLERGGSITAATTSGQGGNILLAVQDLLQLRYGSRVTAEAGGIGNGGNITINADLATILEDSAILASALQGTGGNIQLEARGLLVSPDSTLSASSQLGVDGAVEVKNPQTNPKSGLVKLPDAPVDPTALIAVGCAADSGNQFVITGKGGLPENPTQPLRGQSVWLDWRTMDIAANQAETRFDLDTEQTLPDSVVEAQGWTLNSQGSIELLASVPIATLGTPPAGC